MMKQIVIFSILIMIVTTQTTVNPKTQGCACSNLLSQADCGAKSGCQWTASTTNTTSSSNTSSTSTTTGGTCGTMVTPPVTYTTYCGPFNSTACPQTVGCAWLNNTCQIFTGCTAYVNTTNALCQAISTQCTTDTTKCIPIAQCSTYTKSQQQCEGNVGSQQPYKCKWTASGTTGTCSEQTCKDAPTTYNTLKQCQSWISNCLSTGAGCDTALGTCSTYKVADNCVGRIGSDGNCGTPTDTAATTCVARQCSDAPKTAAFNTDAACVAFQPVKTCLTTQKGCVDSPLPQCSTFKKTDGCTDFKGSDGWCTDDTTANSTACRPLKCSDASFTTDDACKTAVKGLTCVSNGLTCTDTLLPCEQYNDTNSNCLNYIETTNSKCKGTSATETAKANCAARVCKEAPNTLKDDISCGTYKKGCVTNGVGCVDVLVPCSSYTGTTTTCAQYKGNDGNCYAPTTQTTDSTCQAKQCSAADTTFTSNTQCLNYSYLCYTNGKGCTALATCETAQLATTCSGNNSCLSVNNLCLAVSDCGNFKTQSQCLINNQIYKPAGSTVTYSRKCYWNSGSCSNIACSEIASKLSVTQSDLKDTPTCQSKLDGCVFGGAAAGGCVDINDDCTKYTGTLTTCQSFKGSQGKDQCINTTTSASTPAACVKKSCSSAKTQSTGSFTKQGDCTAFITSGCNYDGNDSCTDGDCATYYNSDCTKVATAKDTSGKSLQCVNDASGKCKNKTCADAELNNDDQCNQWLTGCVTDGKKCVNPLSTQCNTYKGTQDQCQKFSYKPSASTTQSCTKLTKICQAFNDCVSHLIPSSLSSISDKSLECQLVIESTGSQNCIFDSAASKCANPTTCDQYVTNLTGASAQTYCNSLKIKNKFCWWSSGGVCATVTDCTSFTILQGTQDKDAATQCQKLSPDGGSTSCGLLAAAAGKCSARTCSDFGIVPTSDVDCKNYLTTCDGYSSLGFCYTLKAVCGDYTIDATTYDNLIKKTQYCSSLIDKTVGGASKCTYDQNTDACLAAETCAQVTFKPSPAPADSDKQNVCANAQDKTGKKCGFKAAGTGCIELTTYCDGYSPIGPSDGTDAAKQTSCQKFVNAAGETCNFKTGASTCNDYTKPTPAFTACSGYMTYQSTDADNLKYCSNLVVSSGGNKCGYSSTTPGSCKTFACSDLTSANCSNFPTLCFYSGITCISVQTTCADYTIEASASDKTAYCKQLTGRTDSKKCAYNSVTSTTKCSDRACADLSTSDSYKTCSDYLSKCLFDGTKCVDSLDCTTFTPTGLTDPDKATFCNKLGDGKKCTFVGGGAKCVAAKSDCTYPVSTLPFAYAQAACSIAQDTTNKKCGYSSGSQCEARSCINAITASTTQNCIDWTAGCELDSTSSCVDKNCNDAPVTAISDTLCGLYKSGCLTTLNGCIDSLQPCSQYQGDATICQKFTGKGIKCNNNKASPTASDACVDKTCADNTLASSNADCDTWYPSKCVWNGTKGCWDNTKNCADFQGTVDSCKLYKAADGPCSGTGLGTTLQACYSNSICTNAPTSTKTDADCKTWHQSCVTNGFGCIIKTSSKCTDIVDTSVCAASALGCSATGNQCLTKPTQCSSFTTASDCNNLLLAGGTTVTCGWDPTKASSNCVNLTCELLPASLTTDTQCAAKLTQGTCTTSGAGCVTKGLCQNYKTQTICQNAKSNDTQGSCTWENSSCRPIKCEDKAVGATDDVCNNYLIGCRTNGTSCVTSTVLSCSSLARQVCLKDGSGNPCYWFQNSCQQYVACTSLTFTSHATCQTYSTSCTSDGTKCIAIDKCASLQKPSCFVGTDNGGSICGWGQITGQTGSSCQVFSNCAAFNGTTNADCALWGSKCISDGTKCIDTANCAAYLTQSACGNTGTDGRCQWVASTAGATGTCRLRQCTDALASDTTLTTFAGCQSYTINSSTKCNTDGKQCISLGACSSNVVQAACQTGTDGDCFWGLPLSSTGTNSTNSASSTSPSTVSSVCRLKVCTDLTLATSSQCSVAISKVDCVSDGTKCIPKATCSSYTTKEACAGKGTDGQCAFTPANSTTPTVGTCKAFSQCSDANSDTTACNSNPSCNFVTNGTSTTCSSHTCASKAQGSICSPIPSFDLSTYQICVLSGTTCVAGSASTLTQSICYDKSVNTYTWNPTAQTCQACNSTQINNTGNNNNTNNSNNTYGYVLSILVVVTFMF